MHFRLREANNQNLSFHVLRVIRPGQNGLLEVQKYDLAGDPPAVVDKVSDTLHLYIQHIIPLGICLEGTPGGPPPLPESERLPAAALETQETTLPKPWLDLPKFTAGDYFKHKGSTEDCYFRVIRVFEDENPGFGPAFYYRLQCYDESNQPWKEEFIAIAMMIDDWAGLIPNPNGLASSAEPQHLEAPQPVPL